MYQLFHSVCFFFFCYLSWFSISTYKAHGLFCYFCGSRFFIHFSDFRMKKFVKKFRYTATTQRRPEAHVSVYIHPLFEKHISSRTSLGMMDALKIIFLSSVCIGFLIDFSATIAAAARFSFLKVYKNSEKYFLYLFHQAILFSAPTEHPAIKRIWIALSFFMSFSTDFS